MFPGKYNDYHKNPGQQRKPAARDLEEEKYE